MRCYRLAVSATMVILVLAVVGILFEGTRPASAQHVRGESVIRLLLPEEFVIGYPALLTISVEAFPEDAFGIELPPLAQTLGQGKSGGIGIEVCLWPKDKSGGSVVGSTTYGIREPGAQREEPQTAEGGRRARLQPGEPYFTTVDVYQLPFYSRAGNDLQIVRVGEGDWIVKTVLHASVGESERSSVRIRKSLAREEEVATVLRTKGLGQSWFPQVLLSDEPVPECDDLPMETRRIVRMIALLRAARRSCNEGLDLIQCYETAEDWGYLQRLVDYVELECAVESGEGGLAGAKRNEILGGADTDVNIREIDAGRGLVRHLRELKTESMPPDSTMSE